MRILHCINSPHIGGIERLVIELAIEQQKKEIDVSIMLDTRNGHFYDYLISKNLSILDSGIKGGFDINPKTYKRLKLIFNTFDVIHLHSFSALRSAAAKASKAKVVYTIHGLSKGIRSENPVKYWFREKIKQYYLGTVNVFVANSRYTLSKAKSNYKINNKKSKVILNGVKIEHIEKQQHKASNKEFVIGLMSRFTFRKRVDRLLNAFKSFLEKGGSAKLVLVGDGEAYVAIQQQIKELNLQASTELVGYVEDTNHYYTKFDILVHPSDNEGFGLVAVEAYLHGLPVLAFKDSGGLKEVVEPLEPKNIVKDEEELTTRLLYYAQNRNKIDAKREKRISYVKNKFSIQRMEQDYYNIYKSLLRWQ